MEKLYKEILKKYNDNEYVIKSRLNETKIEKSRYSYLAKEYMVFLWMKENNDDRWKQMIKTILLPNNLVCDTANLDITEIMNFIGKTDTDESVISLFLDKIEKVETKEVEEDYFQIEDEETFEVKVVETKEDDVFFEILEEITEEKPKEEPKKEVKKRTKKAVKPLEVKIEEIVESVIEEPVVEVVSTIEEEVKSVVQTESECEIPTPYHTLLTQDVNTNEYSESITIDRYVYKLIESVEDKTKYIETLILKDLFSK